MRFGILSDVHGNLHALEAAIAALEDAGVDGFLCLGDLVGFGPQPDECVARVAELSPLCVAGNHDLIAIGRLSDDRCSRLARTTLRWTRNRLGADARRYLEQLPLLATHDRVVLAHGSLEDPTRYVYGPAQAAEQLAHLRAHHPSADVLLLGHTHVPLAFVEGVGVVDSGPAPGVPLPRGRRVLLNPGSVGQSRVRVARVQAMILSCDARTATFLRIRYDVRGCRRELRRRGLPRHACHRRPYGLRSIAMRAESTARSLARR